MPDVRMKYLLSFKVGDKVHVEKCLLEKEVIRFGKRGKLNPRYIGTFLRLHSLPSRNRLAYRLRTSQRSLSKLMDREVKRLEARVVFNCQSAAGDSRRVLSFTWELEGP
ncbi:hypothetical protein Tco_0103020 [Tanacetum coccineum]